jgi:hypothetical protein
MTATPVSYSNIVSQPWQLLYDLLNTRSIVADPAAGSAEQRKWVYTRSPDVAKLEFSDFPFFFIRNVGGNFSSGSQRANGNARRVVWNAPIEVWTCDRGFNNRAGRGAADNDTIANSIAVALNSLVNRKTLSDAGLKHVNVEVLPAVPTTYAETLVYKRTILVSFENHLKVSA